MARVFLDTNWIVDIAERNPRAIEVVRGQEAYASPLSFHILCYVKKIKTPNKKIRELSREFQLVPLTENILEAALEGPTSDIEDNIQLHSAAHAECGYLFTHDQRILKMKFFGKTRLIDEWLLDR